MENEVRYRSLDPFSATYKRAVQEADKVFLSKGWEKSRYKETVEVDGSEIIISYTDRNSLKTGGKKSIRGNPGLLPGLNVYLDKGTLTVLKSSLIR